MSMQQLKLMLYVNKTNVTVRVSFSFKYTYLKIQNYCI